MKRVFAPLILVAAAAALSAPVNAQSASREHIEFAGMSGTVIEGYVNGRDTIHYELHGEVGQTMTVRLYSTNPSAQFTVFTPGQSIDDSPFADSSIASPYVLARNEFSGSVPASGTYSVVVALEHDAAHSGQAANFLVEFDLVSPTSTGGDPALFQVRTRSSGGHLNVHSDPSVDAPRVGRFENGAILRNIGGCAPVENRDWCEVMAEAGGTAGWVAQDYLAGIARVPDHAPTIVRPPTPILGAGPDFFEVTLHDHSAHLNVHASPSLTAPITARFPDGATLRSIGGCAISEGRRWCDLMAAGGGAAGWAVEDLLTPTGVPGSHVSIETAPAPSEDFAGGLTGGPDLWAVSVRREGSLLRVHSAPSTHAPIVARFSDGAVLRNRGGCRMNEGMRWCLIESYNGNLSGWAAGEFLVEGTEPTPVVTQPVATQLPEIPTSSDALVVGTDFHATGQIACRHDDTSGSQSCDFGVVREGNGNGSVEVFWPNGGSRTIYFEGGEAVRFDWSQADGDAEISVIRDADMSNISIGDARFTIPDAIIFGG